MKLPVILAKGEDGYIVAECPVLPGGVSQGKTRDEVLANIREAIELYLETKEAPKLPTAFEIAEVEVAI
ncbi:MAG: type II toxin-antitoxin system HicB family antitoxin [Thermanaeromonas sp.]|uniref:type II toxin-antitoxin system HicB family antitoxin n=1 Tax=Thermanaeromonas sp. TaxID=2003697 RepID=UPI00243F3151|nr:type II toxin-antitoxin system HicB family antitoxin [Thermanaeromonas sp.]MCG0277822.1 type II toxin-antitoxin system HicB family antitoxin [Thermanaeromonas sp.]